MKKMVALLLGVCSAYGADNVQSNSGTVVASERVVHGEYVHTKLTFDVDSSAQPMRIVIWLYNEERRLKIGVRIRLEWALYGTDDGSEQVGQCLHPPDWNSQVEPCVLQKVVSIQPLAAGNPE